MNERTESDYSDLFAFAGVRQIIGDPHGKLMHRPSKKPLTN
jgi:hypothetical protein